MWGRGFPEIAQKVRERSVERRAVIVVIALLRVVEDVLVMVPPRMLHVNVPRARVRLDQIPRQQTTESDRIVAIASAIFILEFERPRPTPVSQDPVGILLECAEAREIAPAALVVFGDDLLQFAEQPKSFL